MRKLIFIIVGALSFIGCFLSCNGDIPIPDNPPQPTKSVTLRAGISSDAATRVALGEEVNGETKVLWSPDDQFVLVNGTQKYIFKRSDKGTENAETADFSYFGTALPDVRTEGLQFCYPATQPASYASQPGTIEGLASYVTMTAEVPLSANTYEGLQLTFKHNTAIVKMLLTNEAFKGKAVTVSLNAAGLLAGGNLITTSETIRGDVATGMVTAYLVVPASEELSDCRIYVTCNGTNYKTTLEAKSLVAGRLYEVIKNDLLQTEENPNTPTSLLLPTGTEFNATVSAALSANTNLTKIKFVTNSSTTSEALLVTDVNGTKAYLIPNGDCLEIHTVAGEYMANKDCYGMFGANINGAEVSPFGLITGIDFSSNFNTSNVEDMSCMFGSCSSLASLNVSSFNTSRVTTMRQMFSSCSELVTLDVSNFDTDNVKDMFAMFSGCSSLSSLDVNNFNTANVEIMQSMFKGCSSLTSLDVTNFITSNVKEFYQMFWDCSSLTSLDVRGFDTSAAIELGCMFYGCVKLTTIDVTGFNTSSVTDLHGMFWNCTGLETLDVSGFDTSKVTTMAGMFHACESLISLDLTNFSFAGNPNVYGMLGSIGKTATNRPIPIYVMQDAYTYFTEITTDCDIPNYAEFVITTGNNAGIDNFINEFWN